MLKPRVEWLNADACRVSTANGSIGARRFEEGNAYEPGSRIWFIINLCVHRDSRGRGEGTLLIEQMRELLWSREKLPIYLVCAPYDGTPTRWLRGWYRRRGFLYVGGSGIGSSLRVCKVKEK